MDTPTHINTKT